MTMNEPNLEEIRELTRELHGAVKDARKALAEFDKIQRWWNEFTENIELIAEPRAQEYTVKFLDQMLKGIHDSIQKRANDEIRSLRGSFERIASEAQETQTSIIRDSSIELGNVLVELGLYPTQEKSGKIVLKYFIEKETQS